MFGEKNIETTSTIPESKSIALRTSPLKRNKLFTPSNPAQNNTSGIAGVTPNIIIRKTKQDIASIDPRILTSMNSN